MNQPLHIKLLEQLEKQGLGVKYNISAFIVAHFDKPTAMDHKEWREQTVAPNTLLRELNERNLIKLEKGEDFYMYIHHSSIGSNFGSKETFEIKSQWYDDYNMIGQITSDGLDYLDGYRLLQSNIKLNEASINNYRSQKWYSFAIIFFSAVSAAVSFFTYRFITNKEQQTPQTPTQAQSKKPLVNKTPEKNHHTIPKDSSRKR